MCSIAAYSGSRPDAELRQQRVTTTVHEGHNSLSAAYLGQSITSDPLLRRQAFKSNAALSNQANFLLTTIVKGVLDNSVGGENQKPRRAS
jgi:hypothetical protein